VLKQTRAPDHGDLDIVATVLPAARKRGLRVFCSIEDAFRSDVPGVREVSEWTSKAGEAAGCASAIRPCARSGPASRRTCAGPTTLNGILFFNERNRAAVECARRQPRAEHRLVTGYLLLRASPTGGEGARH